MFWVGGVPLELVFEFSGAEYNIDGAYVWNYYLENYAVDKILLTYS